jgi:hypothetical protein
MFNAAINPFVPPPALNPAKDMTPEPIRRLRPGRPRRPGINRLARRARRSSRRLKSAHLRRRPQGLLRELRWLCEGIVAARHPRPGAGVKGPSVLHSSFRGPRSRWPTTARKSPTSIASSTSPQRLASSRSVRRCRTPSSLRPRRGARRSDDLIAFDRLRRP